MKIIFKLLLSIKTRLLNLLLTFLNMCRIVSNGYEKENFYKNVINEELRKHEENFNFWTNEEDREKKYLLTKNLINKIFSSKENTTSDNKTNLFKDKGCLYFEELNLGNDKILKIHEYIENKKIYLNHIVSFSNFATKNFKLAKFFSKYGSYSLKDILNCKELFEIISDEKLHKFISNYFGCTATISNANLFWTFPKLEDNFINARVSRYHRDLDDFKSATLFINLTDTLLDDGGHAYVEGSHKTNFLKDKLNNNELRNFNKDLNSNTKNIDGYNIPEEIFNNEFKEKIFYGLKGQAVITDNYGIHRAISPKKPRLVFWLTFSLTQSNGMNNLKISNILPQKRQSFSNFKNKIENSLLNKNKFKNLINFEL